MKKLILVLSAISLLIHCKPNNNIVKDAYTPFYTTNQILEKLNRYCQKNQGDSMNFLIQEWNKLIENQTKEYVERNDTIANIYQIFDEMYQPLSFGNFQSDGDYHLDTEYFIVQNQINYAVVSSNKFLEFIADSEKGYPEDTVYNYYKTKVIKNLVQP
jgi:hypothetical protein